MKPNERIFEAFVLAIFGVIVFLTLAPAKAYHINLHWPAKHNSIAAATNSLSITVPNPNPIAVSTNLNPLPQSEEQDVAVPQANADHALYVPVLMYHHVGEISTQERARDPIASDLTVSPSDFEAQVAYFHDRGFHSITMAQLYAALKNGSNLPSKPIIFTFDDGYKDVFVNAVPILQKYGYTGSFAIATELLGRPTYAVWSDVAAADKAGMEILSHSENHLDLTNKIYSEEDLHREIFDSKTVLESHLGHTVDFFVYPYGHYNYHVGELVAEAGYKMAFTTNYGVWIGKTNLVSEPRVRVHGVDGLSKLKSIFQPQHTVAVRINP